MTLARIKQSKFGTYFWQHGVIGLLLFSMITFTACTQTQVDTVLSDIDLALQTGNTVCSAIGVVDQPVALACESVAQVGIGAITVVETAYNDYEASNAQTDLAKLQAALAAVKTELSAALAAAHITDPVTLGIVTAWVNLVISTVDTIVNLIPQLQAGGVVAASAISFHAKSLPAGFPTAESIKARWDTEVCKSESVCERLITVHHKHGKIKL